MTRIAILSIALVVLFSHGHALPDESINGFTVESLLEGYEASLRLAERIAYEATVVTELESDLRRRTQGEREIRRVIFRRDRSRLDSAVDVELVKPESQADPQRAQRWRWVVTDGRHLGYEQFRPQEGPKYVLVDPDAKRTSGRCYGTLSSAAVLEGLDPLDGTPIVEVLRNSASLELSRDKEVIDNHVTYRLVASGRFGRYVLCLDPGAGFQPRRITIRKQGNDLLRGRPISRLRDNSQGAPSPSRPAPVGYEITVDGITIDQVEGCFVITAAQIVKIRRFEGGKREIFRQSAKRENIDLNPDFAEIGAFVLDEIRDGTPVNHLGLDTGVRFEWRDGRIVPKVDTEVLEAIDRMTGVDRADSKSVPEVGAGEPPSEPRKHVASAQATSWLLWVLTAAAAGGVILTAFILLRRKKRSTSGL